MKLIRLLTHTPRKMKHAATSNVPVLWMDNYSAKLYKHRLLLFTNFCSHEINEDGVDKEENEERRKHQHHVMRYGHEHANISVILDYHSHELS